MIVWGEINMDFVKLPKSNKYDAILVVIDRLSKYEHFIPLKHPYMVEVFREGSGQATWDSSSIISDKDPIFLSLF